MSFSWSRERPAIWLLRKITNLWVRSTARPPDVAQTLTARNRQICYVLERDSLSDLLALQDLCVRSGLPRPSRRLGTIGERRSLFALERSGGLFRQRVDRRTPQLLTRLVAAASVDRRFDIDLVPVGIFWGRAPQKEGSWFRLLLSENWALAGRFRKFMTVLFNGRNTQVQFGEPLSLRAAVDEGLGQARTVRRMSRHLRAQLRNQRAAVIGPDLSHRRTVVAQVLATRAVRAAIAQERSEKKLSRREALWVAKGYLDEIAANYSHTFVVFMARMLTAVWNRLYDGVDLHHEETLHRAADGNEVVYVPCHRSHMDYLLLSYIIYVKGLAVPHIAAGANLNMPVIGRFLRKGGAFFLRRTFKGAALYSIVFMKYVGVMLARGHALEYFVEGGRSRTGRLLDPKTGMLSMTVRGFLTGPRRPVVFVPVYFGYERLVEGETYIGELSGRPKEKESVWGLARTLPKLRQKFGKVHVSVGEPIPLSELLARHEPAWAQLPFDDDSRPPWFAAALDDLARRIMVHINAAAAVTPINLLAVVLLATPRQAMLESDLERQLALCSELLRAVPYSNRVTVTAMTPLEIIRHGEAMRMVARERHPLGDVVSMSAENAILATYYRNNVLHLFALPSLIACCFLNNPMMRTADVQRLVWRIYPYVADELFLRWREDELGAVVEDMLREFAARGLIDGDLANGEWRRRPPTEAKAMQLSVLAQGTIQIVERYYLAIALLIQAGSGALTQEALEKRCHLMAQRMSMLFELNSPEFFDRTLFASFIDLLRRRGVIQVRADNLLVFNEVLLNVANDATLVLSEQIRHSILRVAHS